MKIFLSFLQSEKQHNIPAYSFWQYYIKNGIEEAGHTWTECRDVDWALGLVPKGREEQESWKTDAWTKTVDLVKRSKPDLFLSYLYPEQIDVAAIAEIRNAGIPCINFFCDNVRNFRKAPAEYAAFDLNWVPEYGALNQYKQAGYPHINLPMPVWTPPAERMIHPENNEQLTFIGSHDGQRQQLLESLLERAPETSLGLYGRGWVNESAALPANRNTLGSLLRNQLRFVRAEGAAAYMRKLQQHGRSTPVNEALLSRYGGSPDSAQYQALTASSRITLGINRFPSFRFPADRPHTYSRLRDLEAPLMGACYLTEYAPGIEQLFDIDTEIRTYRNTEELAEQIARLNHDAALRLHMKQNGQRRVLANHTIGHSISKIKVHFGLA